MGCPRPKYFFSCLPNLLPQKIRLPLISFFSGVSYIQGITSEEAPQGTGSDWKKFPGTAHTNRHHHCCFSRRNWKWPAVGGCLPWPPCPALFVTTDRQTPCLLLYIGFALSFLFLNASTNHCCCYVYCSSKCSRASLVHLILSLSISYPYSLKFHDFVDNSIGQEGMKHQMRGATQAQQGMTFTDNSIASWKQHSYLGFAYSWNATYLY